MISGHFPFTYGHSHAWLILVVLMALGAVTRHYFNLRHKGKDEWWILAGAAFGVIALAILIRPDASSAHAAAGPAPAFAEVQSIVARALRALPLAEPDAAGLRRAGRGDPARHARADRGAGEPDPQRSRSTRTTMPLGNATKMTDEERQTLARLARVPLAFPRMLEIVAAGMTFRARWEEADAPATVAAFKAILPFEDRIIHCRWSGESNWIPWGDRELGIGPENATCYPAPGQLLLYPGGVSETELLFPYGHCAFGSKAGALAGNHFATVVEGLEQLPALGRLTLWEGAQAISFRAL